VANVRLQACVRLKTVICGQYCLLSDAGAETSQRSVPAPAVGGPRTSYDSSFQAASSSSCSETFHFDSGRVCVSVKASVWPGRKVAQAGRDRREAPRPLGPPSPCPLVPWVSSYPCESIAAVVYAGFVEHTRSYSVSGRANQLRLRRLEPCIFQPGWPQPPISMGTIAGSAARSGLSCD
jgi:hypothetical protein